MQSLKKIKIPVAFPQRCKIFYGTQSGTAERLAQSLREEAVVLGAFTEVKVICFSAFDPKKHFKDTNEINLICVASHYSGDPTDNTLKFYEWVQAQTGKPLAKMSFALFGLGDSSYENYQAVGRYFDTRLVELGAKRLVERGEGNSQNHKTEDQFDEWKKPLWKSLVNKYPSIEFRAKITEHLDSQSLKLEFSDEQLE